MYKELLLKNVPKICKAFLPEFSNYIQDNFKYESHIFYRFILLSLYQIQRFNACAQTCDLARIYYNSTMHSISPMIAPII